jgi:hypothetical protein
MRPIVVERRDQMKVSEAKVHHRSRDRANVQTVCGFDQDNVKAVTEGSDIGSVVHHSLSSVSSLEHPAAPPGSYPELQNLRRIMLQ